MGRRVLRRHIWGYSVCLCPIKGTSGLYGLKAVSSSLLSPHYTFSNDSQDWCTYSLLVNSESFLVGLNGIQNGDLPYRRQGLLPLHHGACGIRDTLKQLRDKSVIRQVHTGKNQISMDIRPV